MRKLAELCIKRPVFATMLILALVVLGLDSYRKLGVDFLPKVEFPIITVTTPLRGASPEEVETLEPIEVRGTETWLCVNGDMIGAQGAWRHVMINHQQLLEHFPKAASALGRIASTISAETKCTAWLEELMGVDRNNQNRWTNEKLRAHAETKFSGLGKKAFERAKAAAIKTPGAIAWGAAGAPRKSPPQ